ncbi:MAG TPA: peptidylprolyl isomerase [Longimicrobiales bacterium]|nr:peptidylprolyl isomerase [Longimicrobiales bacterium]
MVSSRDDAVRRRACRALLLAAALLPLPACGRPAPEMPPAPRRVDSAEHYRPLDGLLKSARLQQLVDLQIDRNGEALAAALGDADPRVRARAAFALASVQDTLAVPSLTPLLADADPLVRADAAFALGQTPTAGGAAALLSATLTEADTTVLLVMLDALGRAGGAAELDGLAGAELAPSYDEAHAIAGALALAYARFAMQGIYDEEAMEWLAGGLSADSSVVRRNAAYYFARSRDAGSWAGERRMLARALDHYAFADRAAMHLLTALARLDEADDDPRFVEWLSASPDWAIRVHAARALGQRPESGEARAALLTALGDSSHHVRSVAAAALAQASLTTFDAETLISRLPAFREEPVVHGSLLRAIAAAGRGDWVLEHWYTLSDARLRRSGLAALARVPGRAGFAALERAAQNADSTVASAAVEALAQRRALDIEDVGEPRYYAVFTNALRTRDLAVMSAAAGALADSAFEPLGAGPALQSIFLQLRAPDQLDAMVAIAEALGALRDRTAEPLLREARASTWAQLRTAAAGALARITGEPEALPAGDPPPTPMMQWDWLARWGTAPRLRLETERGTIVIELSAEQAPLTVQTVLQLASDGRHDGVPFHRVVPNFVVQGGDVERGDGWGGPGFAMRSEFTRLPFLRGSAGMASSGKDTEGSQYFLTHGTQPHLDGRYTSFGTVVEGLEVLDAIRVGDRVLRATIAPTPGLP